MKINEDELFGIFANENTKQKVEEEECPKDVSDGFESSDNAKSTKIKGGKESKPVFSGDNVDLLKQIQSMLQQPISLGSVAYGLPTIAVTRRTLDTQVRMRQLEMVNDKLTKIFKRPQEYVKVSDSSHSDDSD